MIFEICSLYRIQSIYQTKGGRETFRTVLVAVVAEQIATTLKRSAWAASAHDLALMRIISVLIRKCSGSRHVTFRSRRSQRVLNIQVRNELTLQSNDRIK